MGAGRVSIWCTQWTRSVFVEGLDCAYTGTSLFPHFEAPVCSETSVPIHGKNIPGHQTLGPMLLNLTNVSQASLRAAAHIPYSLPNCQGVHVPQASSLPSTKNKWCFPQELTNLTQTWFAPHGVTFLAPSASTSTIPLERAAQLHLSGRVRATGQEQMQRKVNNLRGWAMTWNAESWAHGALLQPQDPASPN